MKTLAITALLACSVQAGVINLSTSGTAPTTSGTGFGNSMTFAGDGFDVTVTAFSLLNAGSTFSTGQVGRYSSGLGVCNQDEGTFGNGCSPDAHQVDNYGNDRDFLLFQFTAPVTIGAAVIDPTGPSTADRDVAYYLGNVIGVLNLDGVGLGSLGGLGFGSEILNSGTQSLASRSVSVNAGLYNALIFGVPTVGSSTDYYKDYYKLFSIEGTKPNGEVPEPGTMALLGSSLLGLGLVARRRAARK